MFNLNDAMRPPKMFTAMDSPILNQAKSAYDKLMEQIKCFQKILTENDELGIGIVSSGMTTDFHIRQVYYEEPYLICFIGVDENNQKVLLIQHVSQLNILLKAVNKIEEKAHRIGF